jgi:hypothetical protein
MNYYNSLSTTAKISSQRIILAAVNYIVYRKKHVEQI